MRLDWDLLSDHDFESLCYDILEKNGFQNIEWFGLHGNDRQRDIKCIKPLIIFGNRKIENLYLVQCKKWISRPPSPKDLNATLAWADAEKPDFLLFMISNTLTSSTRDWLSKIERTKNYRILVYEEKDFEKFLENDPKLYKNHFKKKDKYICTETEDSKVNEKLLMCLAKKGNRTADEISKEICESLSKTGSSIERFLSSGILISSKAKTDPMLITYSLKDNLATFIQISEQLLQSKSGFDFLASLFSQRLINNDLIKYIEDKFFLSLSEQKRKGVLIILRISPRALSHALFSSNQLFETGFRQMQTLNLEKEVLERWKKSYVTSFVSDLLEKTMEDLHHPDCKKTLEQEKIDGYTLNVKLKMANIEKPMLTLSAKSAILRLRAKGKVEAGELLSATTPDLFLQTGGILLNLEQYVQAISDYEKVIQKITEKEKLKVAWNNKGICLMRLGKPEEAILCFDEALKIDPDLKEAKKNKELCLDMLNAQKSQSSNDG